ncbi:MAG: asparagine synthase (glutamine-hydrolyzing) [Lentisphaeria bacterium]|nr:asparagine synthase (glutamine-hydrolyzing) [Lentisphaeria bacterium]
MCGIFGFAGRELPDEAIFRSALDTLTHRGPDQSGIYADTETGLKFRLGHRRLSILDLSEAGRQPFVTPDREVAVAVNGEIYNCRELRSELEKRGAKFRSESDSEVLLWGFYFEGEKFFVKLRGMYAAAVWDRRTDTPRVLLLRDRMGIKPMYYHCKDGELVFGSELKAITALPCVKKTLCRATLDHFLVLRYIPSPLTIYEDTFKVAPGQYVVFENGSCRTETYWRITVPEHQFAGTFEDAADELDRLVNEAVEEQLMSDVPLGAFLSGGIDSSLICAVAQRHLGGRRLKTFTIGFGSAPEDESVHARKIAEYLGTDHTCEVMTEKELFAILPELPGMYDEPYADDSALPTCLLSGVARKQVTAALSGDGGDELFYGYNNLSAMRKFVLLDRFVPRTLRRIGGGLLSGLFGRSFLGRCGRTAGFCGMDEAYSIVSGVFAGPVFRQLTGREFDYDGSLLRKALHGFEKQVKPDFIAAFLDMALYLPDDICCKVDRASMAHSLEVRPPLLDHRIVEFAVSLPDEYKYTRAEGGKRVLKQVLSRYVPRELWDRPKQGFSTPVRDWFRRELKADAADRLAPGKLASEWGFRPEYVRSLLEDHWGGRRDNQYYLWLLYCLETWRSYITLKKGYHDE